MVLIFQRQRRTRLVQGSTVADGRHHHLRMPGERAAALIAAKVSAGGELRATSVDQPGARWSQTERCRRWRPM
jgi:hypothetical protein